MHSTFKLRWPEMPRGRVGHRFQDRYAKMRKARNNAGWAQRGRRVLRLIAALMAIVLAVLLMFLPGPAIVFYFFAGAILASESIYIARLMDWGEVRVRALWRWGKDHWRKTPHWGRVVLVALLVLLSAASTYVSYRLVRG